MKILIINDYGTLIGGGEVMTLLLRDGLRQRGHDVRIFSSSARPSDSVSLADYECFGTNSPRLRILLQPANPSAFFCLHRVLKEFQPDVVHVRIFLSQISPLILPLLQDIPTLFHVIEYRAICPLGNKLLPDGTNCSEPAGTVCYRHKCIPVQDWLPQMLKLKLWQHWRNVFNLIVANSEAVKSRLVAEGIEPVEVVLNGLPIRPPRPPLVSPPTLVFAGRLSNEKGIDVLVQAFAKLVSKLPQARLLIAGDGPQRDYLASLIAELGLGTKISLLGFLSHPEMERHFAPSWVQVVPSLWAESFGIVSVEAMMRGTAVVASNIGGLTEIVKHGETGFLVPPQDVDALAEALLRLLQNQELAEKMGKAGREVALAKFNEAMFVDRFISLYQRLK